MMAERQVTGREGPLPLCLRRNEVSSIPHCSSHKVLFKERKREIVKVRENVALGSANKRRNCLSFESYRGELSRKRERERSIEERSLMKKRGGAGKRG